MLSESSEPNSKLFFTKLKSVAPVATMQWELAVMVWRARNWSLWLIQLKPMWHMACRRTTRIYAMLKTKCTRTVRYVCVCVMRVHVYMAYVWVRASMCSRSNSDDKDGRHDSFSNPLSFTYFFRRWVMRSVSARMREVYSNSIGYARIVNAIYTFVVCIHRRRRSKTWTPAYEWLIL